MTQPFEASIEAFHGGVDLAELTRWGIAPETAIDFSSNILPDGPSVHVMDAVRNTPFDRYPDRECRLLRNAIAGLHSIDEETILVGNGCSELIHWIAAALIRPQDNVLIVGPTFAEYARATQLANGEVSFCDATTERDFAFPMDEVELLLSRSEFTVVWICNPNNPTGKSVSRDRLTHWLRNFPTTVFVIDEAYIEFTELFESLIHSRFDNLIVLRSMTKAYAIAGLRLGYGVMCKDLLRLICGRRTPWSVNSMAQSAGLAAINDRNYYLNAMVRLRDTKRLMVSELVSRGFRPIASETCYFLLPMKDAGSVRLGLLRDGLVVRDCQSFGVPNYLRIAVHRPENNSRLVEALASRSYHRERPDCGRAQLIVSESFSSPRQVEDWNDSFRADLNRLFRRRRDVRRFKKFSIPKDSIRRWMDAACLAPSVGLSQPWRFVSVSSMEYRSDVVREFEKQNEIAVLDYDEETAKRYRSLKLAGLREAPEHLAVFVEQDPKQGRGLGRATMPESIAYSVVSAIQNFWLAARSEGVGVGWVSILRPEAIASILQVPDDWQLIAYLCIGYPEDSADDVPELERAGWEKRGDVQQHWFER